jgi:glycosyltransferase involved in cell wall biosynthesis
MIETSNPKALIIHILPNNLTVCGGIKVHFQLAELEKQLGYNSYAAFPQRAIPTWFKHPVTCISYEDARVFLLIKDVKRIIIGWEDIDVLKQFDADIRISYIQGESLIRHSFEDFEVLEKEHRGKIWYSSKWNRSANKAPVGSLIRPYIDTTVFYPNVNISSISKVRLLVLARKRGKECWGEVEKYLSSSVKDRLDVRFLYDTTEEQFAIALRQSDIFFSHSYPEGLGLPSLESFASKTLVIGYSGGGGTDFMVSGENCFSSPTGDAPHVAEVLSIVTNPVFNKQSMLEKGYSTVLSKYSKDNTLNQLKVALDAML